MLQEPHGKVQHTSSKEQNCQIMTFKQETLEEEMEATSKESHPTKRQWQGSTTKY